MLLQAAVASRRAEQVDPHHAAQGHVPGRIPGRLKARCAQAVRGLPEPGRLLLVPRQLHEPRQLCVPGEQADDHGDEDEQRNNEPQPHGGLLPVLAPAEPPAAMEVLPVPSSSRETKKSPPVLVGMPSRRGRARVRVAARCVVGPIPGALPGGACRVHTVDRGHRSAYHRGYAGLNTVPGPCVRTRTGGAQ